MTTAKTVTSAVREAAAGTHRAVPSPHRWAMLAMVIAPTATPKGWAICLIPMASPLRCAGNQPITTRPLAALVLAPKAPMANRDTPSAVGESANEAAVLAAAVPNTPIKSTRRSPHRSTSRPHGINMTSTPAMARAAMEAASVRLSPRSRFIAGIKKAGPLIATDELAWAQVLTPRMVQRRVFVGWMAALLGWLNIVDPDRLIELIGGATMMRMLLVPEGDLDDGWVDQTTAILVRGVAL